MFRPLPLWQSIPCPNLQSGKACVLSHCLFSHLPCAASPPFSPPYAPPSPPYVPPSPTAPSPVTSAATLPKPPQPTFSSGDRKRRKLADKDREESGNHTSSSGGDRTRGAVPLDASPAPPPVKRTKTNVDRAGPAVRKPSNPPLLESSLPSARTASSSTAQKPSNPPLLESPLPSARTASSSAARKTSNPPLLESSLPSARTASSPTAGGVVGGKEAPAKVIQQSTGKVESTASALPLTLNPRLVPMAPANHATRLQLLTLLHAEYVRLHEGCGDDQEALRFALDEEEKVAKEMKSIYSQAMKKRIIGLRKTSPADFRKSQEEAREKAVRAEEERRAKLKAGDGVLVNDGLDNNKPPLVTGKTPQEELDALGPLLNSPKSMKAYGYNLEPPTAAEIKKAQEGVEAAGGWEACDRCSTRFQIFKGRREDDGRLTSGGKCTFHWGKMVLPPRSGSAYTDNARERYFTCCRRNVNDPGCTTAENHVYKVSEAKRLAAVCPFIETPTACPETTPAKDTQKSRVERAICLDCEMCYTTLGMELVRLTVTTFPSGEVVIDALVQPQGEILDLNTRFSGVTSSDIISATPHVHLPYPPTPNSHESFINPCTASAAKSLPLGILPSPEAARDLLLSYVDASTPIIGHALENDLNALRLCHKTVIDTAILFPHARGIPARNKLKFLVETYLQRKIQVEGAADGHDSAVDARCAGEMVRFRISGKRY